MEESESGNGTHIGAGYIYDNPSPGRDRIPGERGNLKASAGDEVSLDYIVYCPPRVISHRKRTTAYVMVFRSGYIIPKPGQVRHQVSTNLW